MTINDTWGYTRDNTNWKSAEDLIRKLCDIAHKGGNFLLNVGPTELGEFPQPIVERLEAMGQWLQRNGAAIYGTTRSPWRQLPFNGRCTVKGNRLYLHVFDWPAEGLSLAGLKTPVRRVTALGTGETLKFTAGRAEGHPTLAIARPTRLDPIATVVELQLAGRADVEDPATVVRPGADGSLTLRAADAVIHGSAQYESGGGHDNIGFWTNPQDYVTWELEVKVAGDYGVTVTYACQPGNEGAEFTISLGRRGAEGLPKGRVEATGSWTDFKTVALGKLANVRPGRYTLTVRPTSMPRGAVMNLKEVRLTPAGE